MGWFVSIHLSGKARADGFPKPHEKEVVLDKPELEVRDLGVEMSLAHLFFEPES